MSATATNPALQWVNHELMIILALLGAAKDAARAQPDDVHTAETRVRFLVDIADAKARECLVRLGPLV